MFGRENDEQGIDVKNVETVIGPSVKVDGNFSCAGDMIIEGSVTGTLKTTKNLSVGDQAKVRADVEGNNVIIAGEVRGNVRAHGRLDVKATGKVFGNVATQVLAVDPGAILHGKCQMVGKNGALEEVAAMPQTAGGEHEKKANRKEKERAFQA